jgi:hypothetical protein
MDKCNFSFGVGRKWLLKPNENKIIMKVNNLNVFISPNYYFKISKQSKNNQKCHAVYPTLAY